MIGIIVAIATLTWFARCWTRMFRIYRTRTSDWQFFSRVLGNRA